MAYCYSTMDDTPIAGRWLWLEERDGKIVGLNFYHPGEEPWKERDEGMTLCETPLLTEAKRQLTEYFAGKRREFDLPIFLVGTQFQLDDWKALCTIPYGETRTYGELAAQIGRPKAARAVGMANHNNPISVIVPCHRVIGANGKLVGYGGGLDVKEALLALEGNQKEKTR